MFIFPKFSTQPKAINPRIKVVKSEDDEDEDEDIVPSDKIDPFGENPGWDPSWVKAFKINFLGKVNKYFDEWQSQDNDNFRPSTLQCLESSTLHSGVLH